MEHSGEAWQAELSKRVGEAVRDRRKALGLTAIALSERCAELGLPIHRTTITKIEKGRSGFDLGELLVLAGALNMSPVRLVFPDPYYENVDVTPATKVSRFNAAQWFSGLDFWVPIGERDDIRELTHDGYEWGVDARSLHLWRELDRAHEARSAARIRAVRNFDNEFEFEADQLQIRFLDGRIADIQKELGLTDD